MPGTIFGFGPRQFPALLFQCNELFRRAKGESIQLAGNTDA